ncbi:hypothetical protein D3C75_603310 [compost metagenome]
MREIGTGQTVIVPRPLPANRQYMLYHVYIRQMLIQMVAGERHPERLLRVVIHMVVSVPFRADGTVAPVGEQARAGYPRLDGAIQEVEITVPDPLQECILQGDEGMSPVFPPCFPGLCQRVVVPGACRCGHIINCISIR